MIKNNPLNPIKSADPDQAWREFVLSGHLEKGFKVDDIQSGDIPLSINPDISQEEAMKFMKGYLTPIGYKRWNDRWRQYKRRKLKGLTTITLNQETMAKLRILADRSGLRQDNYDLLFEYLMFPEWEKDEMAVHKFDPEITDSPSGLSPMDKGRLIRAGLKSKGGLPKWGYVVALVEHAFSSGWEASKFLHAKKRTEVAKKSAIEDLIDKLKYD
jgi:hypothetical protein